MEGVKLRRPGPARHPVWLEALPHARHREVIRRRVLVSGASGFVGSHAAAGFDAAGWDVTALLSPRSDASRSGVFGASRVLKVDLSLAEEVSRVVEEVEPDVIVNAAVAGARPSRTPALEELVSTNVLLPMRLYEAMPTTCRLVQLGSMYEFSDFSRPIPEAEANPINSGLYGWSKAAADGLLARLTSSGAKECVRARAFLVIGSREGDSRLIPTLVRSIRERQPVKLSDGLQRRDVLHVSDVVAALVTLAQASSVSAGVVNIARGESVTIRSVAERVAARLGATDLLRFGEAPRRPGEPESVAAVAQKIRELGWSPSLTVDASVDLAVDSELAT